MLYSKNNSRIIEIPWSMAAKKIATNATVVKTVIVYLVNSLPLGQLTFCISRDTFLRNLNNDGTPKLSPKTASSFILSPDVGYVYRIFYKIFELRVVQIE